ncbi:MAG: site-specific integrase [Eubacterium sp.]|nr:site-specific integrase [Eubacterium sp.]
MQKTPQKKKRAKRDNHVGHPVKHNYGWSIRVMQGYNPDGSKHYVMGKGKTKAEARKDLLIKLDEEDKAGINYINIKDMTLSELCMKHLLYDMSIPDKLKGSSVDRRELTILGHIAAYSIGEQKVMSVRPIDIDNHIELFRKKYGYSSSVKVIDVINAAYKWAKTQKYLKDNPCDENIKEIKSRLKKSKQKKSSSGMVLVLSEERIKDIEELVEKRKNDKPHRYIFALSVLLLLYTGMRIGEFCALKWKDWNPKTKTLNIIFNISEYKNRDGTNKKTRHEQELKNYKSRSIVLSEKAIYIINEIYRVAKGKNADDFILVNREYKPTTSSKYDNKLKTFYRDCGFDKYVISVGNKKYKISGAHILRRTCATMMYKNGVDIDKIASYLGDTVETIRESYVERTERIVSGEEIINAVPYPDISWGQKESDIDKSET